MQAVVIGEGLKEEKVLQTHVGETLTIRLWEDRTRGEIYVPSYDPEAVALLNDEYERSFGDSNNAIDAGKRAFEFVTSSAAQDSLTIAWPIDAVVRPPLTRYSSFLLAKSTYSFCPWV